MYRLICLFLLTAPLALHAEAVKSELTLTQGYRRDKLNVHFAGHKDRHIHFKDMDIYATRLQYNLSKDSYFLNLIAGYGDIRNGRFSRAVPHDIFRHTSWHFKQEINGSYTLDLQLALGKKFELCSQWSLSPKVGYSYSREKIHMHHTRLEARHHNREILTKAHIHGVKGSYHADWYSPLVGLRVEKGMSDKLKLYADYSLLFPLAFRGKGELKKHFPIVHAKDHTKANRSFGNIGIVGIAYRLTDWISFGLEYELTKYYAKGGHERLERENNGRQAIRKVNRTTSEIRLAVSLDF